MKHFLSLADQAILDKRIAEAEKITGAQIVLATVKRCDIYAEIPWKAFSFGASLRALMILIVSLLGPFWVTDYFILFSIVSILAGGIIFAVLTIIFPGFARLFLSSHRKETETMQYAESLFLSRELFSTDGRRGILLLVSQFERQVIIFPDKGVKGKLTEEVLKNTISKMADSLKKNEVRKAFETGLDEIIIALSHAPLIEPKRNELSNEIIEEEGA
jgi:uncharacterized membrane protein